MMLRSAGLAVAVAVAGLITTTQPVTAQPTSGAASPEAARDRGANIMSQFLVHVHTGPSDPSKAALAFLVAATALKDGHRVNLFLAGDGVALLTKEALASVDGVGTGRLSAHYEAIVVGGGRFYLSGMSAKARGLGDELLADRPAEFAMPSMLVRLATEADVVLTY
jgi:predicted peroxiredoxin